MTNKEKYRELCKSEASIPIFSRDWWLDAVCGERWDVCIVEDQGEIIASMPFHFSKNKFGLLRISRPRMTQNLGPWLKYSFEDVNRNLSNQAQLFEQLIDSLPEVYYFEQNWFYKYTNWLPFYWKGFEQTTKYTYQIEDISNPDKCFQQFSYAKRKQIKKAEKNLKVCFDLSGEDFYSNMKYTYEKRGLKVSFSRELFIKIYNETQKRNASVIVAIRNESNDICAALFLLYDPNIAYNLISSIDSDYKATGASTLVVWEAIKHLSDKTKVFDFEGSMDKGIENSFRQFGTIQTPYFCVFKRTSKTEQIKLFISRLFTQKN